MCRGLPHPIRFILRVWATVILEIGRINKPTSGLPSYKSYDTSMGLSKLPRVWMAKRAPLGYFSRKCVISFSNSFIRYLD